MLPAWCCIAPHHSRPPRPGSPREGSAIAIRGMAVPAYVSRESLVAAFGEPEIERLESAGLSTAAVCEDVNAAAAAALRQQLPLERVSADDVAALRGHLHNLARYWLHGEIGQDSAVALKAKQALAVLADITAGTYKLTSTDDPDTPANEAVGVWSAPGTSLPAGEWEFV